MINTLKSQIQREVCMLIKKETSTYGPTIRHGWLERSEDVDYAVY